MYFVDMDIKNVDKNLSANKKYGCENYVRMSCIEPPNLVNAKTLKCKTIINFFVLEKIWMKRGHKTHG